MIPESNEMRIEVTTRCNYNCSICPREQFTRKKETMSFDLFKTIIDRIMAETRQYDTLTFPGMGEPLMDNGLAEKIRYAKSRGISNILFLTNGSLLTVEKFKEFESLGVNSVRVSFYGNTAESYSKVHGVKEDTFNRVRDTLTAICSIKKHTSILLTYNVVDAINDAVMDSWIAYWKDKVDLLEVWRPHNWVSAKSFRLLQEKKVKSCGRPWKTPLQVQVDGTVNMCCFDFNGMLTLGDLKKQTLAEIFASEPYRRIEACHRTGNYEGSGLICEHCDQRNEDKTDVMIYNSKYDIRERVKQVSTTYHKIATEDK